MYLFMKGPQRVLHLSLRRLSMNKEKHFPNSRAQMERIKHALTLADGARLSGQTFVKQTPN